MVELGGSAAMLALVVFVSVALGTVGMALLLEWFSERRRRSNALRQLQNLGELHLGESTANVLRREEGVSAPWMKSFEARIPRVADLGLMLRQADVSWTPGVFMLIVAGGAIAFGAATLVATRAWIPAILAAIVGGWIPYFRVRLLRSKRLNAFEEQLPEAIDLLARAIRAGHPLSAGLKMVADELGDPLGIEFRRTFEEQRFGVPFDDAILAMADRVSIVDVRILVTAILIQREVGGNLAEVLDNLAAVIRARFSIRRQLRTYTAQGRMTGYILAVLPIAVATVIYLLNPTYMSLLWTHPIGRFFMFTSIVMQVIGYLWIRKIIDIEI
jgi:tight adherence protein B